MIHDHMLEHASAYTDIQGLSKLRNAIKHDPDLARKEVAQQFESLLMQMLLKGMRESNKVFDSGMLSSQASSMYEDLYDKQLSLALAKKGIGFGEMIENYLKQNTPQKVQKESELLSLNKTVQSVGNQGVIKKPPIDKKYEFETAKEFIKGLWDCAKVASAALQLDPKILLAQAALETNWGKKILQQVDGESSFNLFNIKADQAWKREMVAKETLEYQDGILVKEKSKFRTYSSFEESFKDYVDFLKSNPRYKEALSHAAHPEKFIHSLQRANYATDNQYGDKILQIYHSKKFNELFEI